MCKTRHEIRLLVPGFMYVDFPSETACPMVNFVKISVNRVKLFLYDCRYAIFAKTFKVPKSQSYQGFSGS